VVGYLATQNAPGAVHLWTPIARYPKIFFGLLAALGVLFGLVAGRRSAKSWFVLSLLNGLTFLLEYLVS
jgi:hypothetical protein